MKKTISMALKLLGHKVLIGFQFYRRNGHDSLTRRNERMIRDFAQSYTLQRLAKKYNLTESRVSQILTGFGARHPKWRKMSDETRRTIFHLQKNGLSKAEIGREIGVSRERVRQILQQGSLSR